MVLASCFKTFCTNLKVQNVDTISMRYKNITKRLNTDFWNTTSETSHSLYVGSYGRNSATDEFSDLDMIFELPSLLLLQYNAHIGNGQSALLQRVKNCIRKTYPITTIGADGQVIQIFFGDGITFEVLPAFVNSDRSYTHPDANNGGKWAMTNPKPEINAIRDSNKKCNGNLIRLCRMMRAWKSKWSVPIGGLLIDTLAYQFINHWEYKGMSYVYYDWMCRDFFRFMVDQSKNQQYWLAPGSAQFVYRKGRFEAKAAECYDLSLEAIQHEQAKPPRVWSAIQKWREIFGSKFPSHSFTGINPYLGRSTSRVFLQGRLFSQNA